VDSFSQVNGLVCRHHHHHLILLLLGLASIAVPEDVFLPLALSIFSVGFRGRWGDFPNKPPQITAMQSSKTSHNAIICTTITLEIAQFCSRRLPEPPMAPSPHPHALGREADRNVELPPIVDAFVQRSTRFRSRVPANCPFNE
jgi:hypothetical protein